MNWKDNFSKENRYFETENGILYNGVALEILRNIPDESIDMVITSPPYWALRDYGVKGQIGLEPTFQEYLEKLWQIFDDVYRILKPTGTCWINLGDSYSGSGKGAGSKWKSKESWNFEKKPKVKEGITQKSLCLIPERFAIGMIERAWILRNVIIWHKPNAMPESVKDRFTRDFEYIFFFVKNRKYYFEQQFEPHKTFENRPYGIVRNRIYKYDSKLNKLRGFKTKSNNIGQSPQHHVANINYGEKGRNKRAVWSINTKPFKDAHFAVFPPELVETPIKAGSPKNGIVFDPFFGSGTTGLVSKRLNRKWIGIELNPEYCEIAKKRLVAIQSEIIFD